MCFCLFALMNGQMCGWVDVCSGRRMEKQDGWIRFLCSFGWMDWWMNRCFLFACLFGLMDGWMDKCFDKCLNGFVLFVWVDRRPDISFCLCG